MVRKIVAGMVLAASTAVTAGSGVIPTPPAPTATPAPNLLAARFREVVRHADRQVAASPEWMRIHAGFVVQDWASMGADAVKLTERIPGSADPQVALAVALTAVGDLDQATAALERAVALQPDHANALAMLALLHLERGQFPAAAQALEQGRAVSPGDLGILLALGDAYARSDDPARAATVFQQATVQAPEDVTAWVAYLDVSSRAGNPEPARVAFNQLRLAHPGTAAAVMSRLPSSVHAAMPTPIPPTPRPTPRTDTPRFVMAAGPTGGQPGGQRPAIWNEAALGFEAKVADIGARARPIIELVERYDLTCQGGSSRRLETTAATAEEPSAESKPASVEVDWKAIWARSAAWTQAAANQPTSECRALASDILALAASTRSAVEKAVQSTAGSGMSATDQNHILQRYNLLW